MSKHETGINRLLNGEATSAPESEQFVISRTLALPESFDEVIEILPTPDAFTSVQNAAIFDAQLACQAKGPFDFNIITQRLRDTDKVSLFGNERDMRKYIIDMVDSVPMHAVGVKHHATKVREAWIKRQAAAFGEDAIRVALDAGIDMAETVDQINSGAMSLAAMADTGKTQAELIGPIMRRERERLNAGQATPGISTGYAGLDRMTGGFHPGEMIIVAGRASMGKTSLALGMAEHMGLVSESPLAIFSLEMGREQLAQRLASSRAKVPLEAIRTTTITEWQRSELDRAMDALEASPIVIDDTPGISLPQLRSRATRMAKKHGIRAIFIDYLQLISSTSKAGKSRENEVSELSRGIKAIARDLDLPVICLSQLNRAADNREDHRPRLSDLRESGAIEQDADVVIMVFREDYYTLRSDPDATPNNKGEAIIAKQRNGPTGICNLHFNAACASYADASITTDDWPELDETRWE